MMFGNAEAYDRFMSRWSRVVFQVVCERPPAAFGGSPPHGG